MKAICVHYSEERKDCIIGRFPPCCKCPAFYQRAANETEEKLNDLASAIQKIIGHLQGGAAIIADIR